MEILRALEGITPSGETSVGKILQEVAGKMNRRGLVILISDLLDEPESILEGLHLFRFKGNDVIVFHLLDNAELELPFEGNILFEDMEQVDLKVTADPKAIHSIYLKVVEEFIERIRKGPLPQAVAGMMKLCRSRMTNEPESRPSKPDDLTILAFRRSLP